MIVIYTDEKTLIRNSAEDAKEDLISIYGAKLGKEAYDTIDGAPVGTSYRKHGGALVQVVDKDKAEWIREKETSIGMMA